MNASGLMRLTVATLLRNVVARNDELFTVVAIYNLCRIFQQSMSRGESAPIHFARLAA
jgi:hypothetical protein